MIPIARPKEAPAILTTRGAAQAAADRTAYDSGSRAFDFDSGIYNGNGVKARLLEAEAGKCAFCESLIRHVSYGDVEHYRPKGRVAQVERVPASTPGYYWLAYDWTNLFLACQVCNQSFKHDLFPLRDPLKRARSHHDDLSQEEPLLLDPCLVDPRAHIGFSEGVPFAIAGSAQGAATILVAGLDRDELVQMRRKALRLWKALRDTIDLYRAMEANGALPDLFRAKLAENLAHARDLVAPTAENSAMAAAFFASTITSC